MRVFGFSKAVILTVAILLSGTAALAQENGVDEFQAFRNKLNSNKAAQSPLGPSGSLSRGKIAIDTQSQPSKEMQALMKEESVAMANEPILFDGMTEEERVIAIQNAVARMKKLGGLTTSEKPEHAEDIVANSKIVSVTVYDRSATVTRSAEFDLPAGKHEVVFNDLPLTANFDTLRADGHGQAKVTLGAIITRRNVAVDTVTPEQREAYHALQPLLDQRQALLVQVPPLDAQADFVKSASVPAASIISNSVAQQDVKPEQLLAASKALYSTLADVAKQKEDIRLKLRDLDLAIEKNSRRFMAVQPVKAGFSASVPLESEKPTHFTLQISYQVVNATWQPVYDARLATAGKSGLELVQFGSVRQQTGEDWTNVDLTLSTSKPTRAATMPDLSSLWVTATEPVDYSRAGSAMPMTLSASQEDKLAVPAAAPGGADPLQEWRAKAEARRMQIEEAAPPPEENASFTSATLNTGGYVNEYKIPGPATIAADNSETKLMIGTFPLESRLQIQIRPQVSTDAFLASHAVLKGDAPILPGPASLFRDGAFVGKLDLPLLRPGMATDIFFGADDRVSVKHQTLKDERGQTGMIAKDNSLERDVVTEIENLHKEPVDIVLSEVIPTSRSDKLVLNILEDETTAGYTTDDEHTKGLLRWQATLPPQGKKEFKLGWRLNWPKELNLQGL